MFGADGNDRVISGDDRSGGATVLPTGNVLYYATFTSAYSTPGAATTAMERPALYCMLLLVSPSRNALLIKKSSG